LRRRAPVGEPSMSRRLSSPLELSSERPGQFTAKAPPLSVLRHHHTASRFRPGAGAQVPSVHLPSVTAPNDGHLMRVVSVGWVSPESRFPSARRAAGPDPGSPAVLLCLHLVEHPQDARRRPSSITPSKRSRAPAILIGVNAAPNSVRRAAPELPHQLSPEPLPMPRKPSVRTRWTPRTVDCRAGYAACNPWIR
jgi:hypothetical protein